MGSRGPSEGVDRRQWTELVRTTLKLDFRGASTALRTRRRVGGFLALWLFYVLSGSLFGLLAWAHDDVFLTATLFLTYVMLMVGSLVVIEFPTIVLSPEDYEILGFRPVSSATYFYVRLTCVLFYTAAAAAALSVGPVVGYSFAFGFDPLLGTAALTAAGACALFTTLAAVVLYTEVLLVARPERLRRWVSRLQLLLASAIYAGFFTIPWILERGVLEEASLERTVAWLLFPPSWFAAYLELAAGGAGSLEWAAATVSVPAMLLLFVRVRGRLSLEYFGRLADRGAVGALESGATASAARSLLGNLRGEGLAVALLLRAQFKGDPRFRLSVLGILPLAGLYFALSLREGGPTDPFLDPGGTGLGGVFISMAVLVFPVLVKTSLVKSESWKASWIFFASPCSRLRLILSLKMLLMLGFVVPYLLLVGLVFSFFFESLLHVVVHLSVLGLIAHLLLLLAFLVGPHLPFSQPAPRSENSFRIAFLAVLAPLFALLVVPAVTSWGYLSMARTVVSLAVLAAANGALEWLLRRRVLASVEQADFEG